MRRGILLVLCPVAVALAAAGCAPHGSSSTYEAMLGVVVQRSDVGEITVVIPGDQQQADRALICTVTKDTEIYVDDRFSSVEDVRVGDAIELFGYRDPNPRLERFVVSFASVDRRLNAAAAPEGSADLRTVPNSRE